MEQAESHPSGRLSGVVYPAQIDTCTENLLRDSADLALQSGRPVTTHAAQSVNEFYVMVERHGKTPIQFARDIGLSDGPDDLSLGSTRLVTAGLAGVCLAAYGGLRFTQRRGLSRQPGDCQAFARPWRQC